MHDDLMIDRYYLDESGSTGDLAKPGEGFDFGQQQIFTLSCIGIEDEDALGREISRLKGHYRIRTEELKSTSVREKPELVAELAAFLERSGLPLLVEVVDKRFMIMATLTHTLIAPPAGARDFTPEAQWTRNAMAEYLHMHAPSSLLEVYVAACDKPSAAAVAETFRALLAWLAGQDDRTAFWLRSFANDSLNRFAADASPDAMRRSLPLPDASKRGQPIWMLPNLSSFTNIYARINRLHGRRIGGLTLFHDEQAHFDDILRASKSLAEEACRDGAALEVPFADFSFEQEARLVFTNSHASPGIQAADLLAGFIMRYVKDVLYGDRIPSDGARKAFHEIIDLSVPEEGRGVNFVLTTRDLAKLELAPA